MWAGYGRGLYWRGNGTVAYLAVMAVRIQSDLLAVADESLVDTSLDSDYIIGIGQLIVRKVLPALNRVAIRETALCR